MAANEFDRDGATVDGLRFGVTIEPDYDSGAPWDNMETFGAVRSEWVSYGYPIKRPGERVLHNENRTVWLYDFAGAVAKARTGGGMTGPEAVEQVEREMKYLGDWLRGLWVYVGVVVTLLDVEGNPTDEQESLWGVDDNGDYVTTVVEELALTMHSRVGHSDTLEIPARSIRIREAA